MIPAKKKNKIKRKKERKKKKPSTSKVKNQKLCLVGLDLKPLECVMISSTS